MKEPTNKIKILKTLLESPKSTGNIAIALDYKDGKGHGIYKNIISDLKTLEQYGFIHRIEQKEKRPGAPATTYDIVYEYDDLRKILKEYPILISDLQQSDKILSMLAENVKPDAFVETFKDMLRLSPSFFENCLMNDRFLYDWFDIMYRLNLRACNTNSVILELLYAAFEHCVIEDNLKGISTLKASNLLIELKKGYRIIDHQRVKFELETV